MRDLRDPEQIGIEYLAVRAEGRDIETSLRWAYAQSTDVDANPSCVEKYGRPDDVKPKWEEIQIR